MSAAPARARVVETSRPAVAPASQPGILAPALEVLAWAAAGFAVIRFILRLLGD